MISEAKVVVIGTIGVGKSSLTIRFVYDQFNEHMDSTLGAVYFQKVHNYDKKSIKFQFWDTAGQQKYKSIARIYYKDSKVAIVVYDITRMDTFQALKVWVQQLKENGPPDLILAIVGNKIDLSEQQAVPYKDALEYANNLGAIFKLTSVKDNKGIEDLFDSVAQRIQTSENLLDSNQKKGEQINGKKHTGRQHGQKCQC